MTRKENHEKKGTLKKSSFFSLLSLIVIYFRLNSYVFITKICDTIIQFVQKKNTIIQFHSKYIFGEILHA
jgi:hypothetical protein